MTKKTKGGKMEEKDFNRTCSRERRIRAEARVLNLRRGRSVGSHQAVPKGETRPAKQAGGHFRRTTREQELPLL